ncbi:hypothetical protein B0T10DRAFT_88443 [Thelonectria olida]|uniref:Uncharacterized protein n=1 Tax=Thelonectria olida TaxID=1576542 RepID=A0A9P8VZZ4_9HYPO|nr:hypothetical protein B0T10DRAFT_88443 [Thelonectria olida]
MTNQHENLQYRSTSRPNFHPRYRRCRPRPAAATLPQVAATTTSEEYHKQRQSPKYQQIATGIGCHHWYQLLSSNLPAPGSVGWTTVHARVLWAIGVVWMWACARARPFSIPGREHIEPSVTASALACLCSLSLVTAGAGSMTHSFIVLAPHVMSTSSSTRFPPMPTYCPQFSSARCFHAGADAQCTVRGVFKRGEWKQDGNLAPSKSG